MRVTFTVTVDLAESEGRAIDNSQVAVEMAHVLDTVFCRGAPLERDFKSIFDEPNAMQPCGVVVEQQPEIKHAA